MSGPLVRTRLDTFFHVHVLFVERIDIDCDQTDVVAFRMRLRKE
jgi:hypothetical protein